MNRGAIAVATALVCAFQLTVVCLGYAELGSYVPLASYQRIDPYRSEVVSVKPQGERAGLRVGDVVDSREMPLAQRLARYAFHWRAGTVFPTIVHRGSSVVTVPQPVVASALGAALVLDVFERLILAIVGILLIARGTGSAGLLGGLALIGASIGTGYTLSWGSVPIEVGAIAFVIQACAFPVFLFGLYRFSIAFLPGDYEKSKRTVLAWAFWIIFSALIIVLVERRGEVFFGYSFSHSLLLWQCLQAGIYLYAGVLFWIVAARASGANAPALRILFWSYLLGISGSLVNALMLGFGLAPPFGGILNITYLFFAVGFAYAVFARQLVSINFYVSKAAIYTIVLAVILVVFIFLERLIELAALGRTPSLILELAVPLVLGVSMRGIEHFAESVVERLLYREKLYAEQELEALIADFPHARDAQTLADCVVTDVKRLMRAPSVVLYREFAAGYAPTASAGNGKAAPLGADDRAFLRMRSTLRPVDPDDLGSGAPGELALPLVVVGKVTGALVLAARNSGERYDPGEVQILSKLAHELAITLLWSEREAALTTL
jgi:hypothetical protein